MRKYFFLVLCLAIATVLWTQSKSEFMGASEISQIEPLQKTAELNWWANETLTVEGHGSIQAGANDIERAKLFSKRAAIIDGYRNLARAAGKVQITAKETLRNERIEVLIRGAEMISETYDERGNCTVVLSVPIYGVTNSFAQAAFTPVEKENFPAPQSEVKATGKYTGLIIDCGDLELNPVLSPVIRDAQNQSIYAYEKLDYDKVIARGMIGYVEKKSLNSRDAGEIMLLRGRTENKFVQVGSELLAEADKNLLRAGANPLIIKAESLGDDNSCPVISAEDADKILAENLSTHFLDEGSVVFTSNRIRGMRM